MKHNLDFMERINRDLEARRTACKLLEVEESASEEDLKKALRRAAVACHPDHVENTEDANRRFALIECAYKLLAKDTPCERLLEKVGC
jgi:DnaJ-class molecular chaperone